MQIINCVTGAGGGAIELCYIVEIQQTFDRHRPFAQGLCTVASSLGNLLGAPLTALLQQTYGWQGTLLLHSAIMLNLVPISLLFRYLNEETAKQDLQSSEMQLISVAKAMCDFSAFTDVRFVLFAISVVCFRASSFAISFHLVGRALDVGMLETVAVWLLSGYALGSLIGRLIVTFVADISCINRVILSGSQCLLLTAVSCAIPFVDDVNPSLILSILVGFFHGSLHTNISVFVHIIRTHTSE